MANPSVKPASAKAKRKENGGKIEPLKGYPQQYLNLSFLLSILPAEAAAAPSRSPVPSPSSSFSCEESVPAEGRGSNQMDVICLFI